MHVHLPKPLHGWREFAGEVGIIVVGVLIALGAEQLVEQFHARAALHDAEDAMVSELRDDNLPQAYTRAAVSSCYADQLDAIKNAVESSDRTRALKLAGEYQPIVRTWDDDAWKTAVASQVLARSGAKRMLGWSSAYVMIPRLSNTSSEEQAEVPLLHADVSGDGSLSIEQKDRLLQVISLLKAHNRFLNGESLTLIRFVGEQGLTLSRPQKSALIAEARRAYGPCVHEPSPERLNLKTQLTGTSNSTAGAL